MGEFPFVKVFYYTPLEINAQPLQILKTHRSEYQPALAWFGYVLLASILMLIYAGAFTTTIKAGMVFPDWPLSNGSINPEGWLTNQALFAEHSHRLIGATVGILCIVLVIWLWRRESRGWLRALGWLTLALVILQGGLGGTRVLLNSLSFAMVHGILAQGFLCLVATVALALSPLWHNAHSSRTPAATAAGARLRTWGLWITGILFAQLLVAVLMRHLDAGMSIPTFPLTPEGTLVPVTWDAGIFLNFAHRALAAVLFVGIVAWSWRIVQSPHTSGGSKLLACVTTLILFIQIGLGASIVWTERLAVPTSLHVLNGALLLAATWSLTFLFFKPWIEGIAPAAPRGRSATTQSPLHPSAARA